MLLDEPTAHLDALTEQVIADTLVELGRDQRRSSWSPTGRPWSPLADQVAGPAAGRSRPAARRPGCRPRVARRRRSGRPADDRRAAYRRGAAWRWPRTLLGALASASGVALTATAGWLIVQASDAARRC